MDKKDRGNCKALAFFVGGSSNGGKISGNTVVSNCPAAWLGNDYGNAANTVFYGNTFRQGPNTPRGTNLFVLGAGGNAVRNVEFYSNDLEGWRDLFEYHSRSIAYAWGWTLRVKVVDRADRPEAGAEVSITDATGAEVLRQRTDEKGRLTARLAELKYENGRKIASSSYTVRAGAAAARVDMTMDRELTLRVE